VHRAPRAALRCSLAYLEIRLLGVATVIDELVRLIDDLPEEDLAKLIDALRERGRSDIAAAALVGAIQKREREKLENMRASPSQVSRSLREERPVPISAALSFNQDKTEAKDEDPGSIPKRMAAGLCWPLLGPGTLGTTILMGWVAGIFGGPLLAIAGATVGMFVGDALDRRQAGRESAAA